MPPHAGVRSAVCEMWQVIGAASCKHRALSISSMGQNASSSVACSLPKV